MVMALNAAGEKTEKGAEERPAGVAVNAGRCPALAVSKPAAVNWKGAATLGRSTGNLESNASAGKLEPAASLGNRLC